jgi:Icc-related predicted phosphoesterase
MENVIINVFNVVGSSFGVEAEDGKKVFELIYKALKEKKKVVLSFLNIEVLTTAFLNMAVGQLYKDFSETDIRSNVEVKDITNPGAVALKRVVDTAKLYYKDPNAMERSINELLD